MFYFKVDVLDPLNNYDRKQESGILAAKGYIEAMKRVMDGYGDYEIVSVYLEEWEDLLTEDEVMEGFEAADLA